MMKTYLFYDLETSGLNCSFDQILTFAAIRTDTAFNELDRYALTVSLRDDVIPSPGAFVIHRLSGEALSQGIFEYDAAQKIHKIVNSPGTVSMGYNTLGFDDEFLRFTFYRNLLEPYTHQYADNCYRMDILPVTTLYRIFKPEVLSWPVHNEKPSLKLELINQENRLFMSGRAHDAMTDVEVTLALARILAKEKDTWDYCVDFFDKTKDKNRLKKITKTFSAYGESFRVAIMVSPAFGSACMYLAPVLHIGYSKAYPGQSLWLRLDKNFFPDMENHGTLNIDFENERLFVIRKKFGDAKILLPPLDRFWGRITESQKIVLEENVAAIGKHGDMFKKISEYHQNFEYPVIPDLDPDASLYQSGFFTRREKQEISRFHNCHDIDKWRCLEDMTSKRVRRLAERILFRNFKTNDCPAFLEESFQGYMKKVFSSLGKDAIKGFRGDTKFTFEGLMAEMKELKTGQMLDSEQLDILSWIMLSVERNRRLFNPVENSNNI